MHRGLHLAQTLARAQTILTASGWSVLLSQIRAALNLLKSWAVTCLAPRLDGWCRADENRYSGISSFCSSIFSSRTPLPLSPWQSVSVFTFSVFQTSPWSCFTRLEVFYQEQWPHKNSICPLVLWAGWYWEAAVVEDVQSFIIKR